MIVHDAQVKKRRRSRFIIGGLAIAGGIVAFSMMNLGSNIVYFYTPEEAFTKFTELQSKVVKVGGMVEAGTVVWKAEELHLAFAMTDLKGHRISVNHKGTPPDMFKEGQGVVVEGKLADGGQKMESRKLMVKHSEEYKKPGDHSTMNKALLDDAMFKSQKPN